MAESRPNAAFQVLAQTKELWERQPKRRRTLAVLLVLGVLGAIVIASVLNRAESWTVISDGASPDDSQELLVALSARGLPVRLRDKTVEVASGRIDEARAIAAAAGLPRGGKGFELFDGSSLGQSSFAEQVNFRRALQGELARSITALAQVQAARVHLALGKQSVFKDQDKAPSASVALHLHASQTLSSEQVRGVRQLVAASVDGLKADAVVVVDQHGNLLDVSPVGTVDHKADLERSLTTRIRTMLERVVGVGKVSVVTTAVVDDRKVSETQELYDQERPVLRSESRTVQGGGDATPGIGGVAGTQGNLPGAPAAAAMPAGPSSSRSLQETKNYEVNRTVRQTTKPDAELKRLFVAIVVDQKLDASGKPTPPSDMELAELTALARQAAGIDDARGDKIEVRSIPFAVDPDATLVAAAPIASELPLVPIAIGGGALLLVGLIVIMMMGRRRSRSRPMSLALPAPLADLERALDARPSARAELQTPEPRGLPAGNSIRERVLDVVRNDAERAAEVLTAWLSETAQRKVKS